MEWIVTALLNALVICGTLLYLDLAGFLGQNGIKRSWVIIFVGLVGAVCGPLKTLYIVVVLMAIAGIVGELYEEIRTIDPMYVSDSKILELRDPEGLATQLE